MIQAVIFDCFGVLTTDGWLAFKDRYLSTDRKKQDEATELNRMTDAGLLSHREFLEGVARIANVNSVQAQIIMDTHVRNDKLFDFIQHKLKSQYKIGLLSNVSDDVTDELFTIDQNELFDAKTFSFELGVIKPHPAMYQTIAMKLGCVESECIFIDDREPFVEGATRVGMQALLFVDNQQVIRELSHILEKHNA